MAGDEFPGSASVESPPRPGPFAVLRFPCTGPTTNTAVVFRATVVSFWDGYSYILFDKLAKSGTDEDRLKVLTEHKVVLRKLKPSQIAIDMTEHEIDAADIFPTLCRVVW